MIYIRTYIVLLFLFLTVSYVGDLCMYGIDQANESIIEFLFKSPLNLFSIFLPIMITVITKIYAFIIGVDSKSLDNYAFITFIIIAIYLLDK